MPRSCSLGEACICTCRPDEGSVKEFVIFPSLVSKKLDRPEHDFLSVIQSLLNEYLERTSLPNEIQL